VSRGKKSEIQKLPLDMEKESPFLDICGNA